MIIAMSCTRNWYKYLMVDLYALLCTNKVNKIYLFTEDNRIDELKYFKRFNTEIIVTNYNNFINKYFENNDNKSNKRFTPAALVRLALPKVLKEDKILYLDTDAIVDDDISELWNTNLKDNYIAAVPEYNPTNIAYLDSTNLDYTKYVNSGVLLMNLKKIREDKVDDNWLELLKNKNYLLPDQDAINIACKNKITLLDSKYNSGTTTKMSDEISIMHYVEPKNDWIKHHPNNYIWYTWERRYNDYKESTYDDKGLKIDLIIPVYKAKDFLDNALNSINKQTIKDKVLVTIINDGDKEDYSDILEKYKQSININYIALNKNKGVGYVREYGLKHTSLPYFTFLDSDDEFYDEYGLERLYNLIHYNDKCKVVTGRFISDNIIYPVHTTVWGRMYSRNHLIKNKIHFNTKARIIEDGMFNLDYYSNIKDNESDIINNIIIKYNNLNKESLSKDIAKIDDTQKYLKYVLKSHNLSTISEHTALNMLGVLFDLYKKHKLNNDNLILINKLYKKIKNIVNHEIYYGEHTYLKPFIEEIKKY